eukprot:2838471-Rhodomonas_salina.2
MHQYKNAVAARARYQYKSGCGTGWCGTKHRVADGSLVPVGPSGGPSPPGTTARARQYQDWYTDSLNRDSNPDSNPDPSPALPQLTALTWPMRPDSPACPSNIDSRVCA